MKSLFFFVAREEGDDRTLVISKPINLNLIFDNNRRDQPLSTYGPKMLYENTLQKCYLLYILIVSTGLQLAYIFLSVTL